MLDYIKEKSLLVITVLGFTLLAVLRHGGDVGLLDIPLVLLTAVIYSYTLKVGLFIFYFARSVVEQTMGVGDEIEGY